jgi:tRNA(Ile)-lysidine synthase
VEIVRPLLQVRRSEVNQFLADIAQAFRQDSSNCDLRLTRNRIRHELLPELSQRFDAGVTALLARLAETARLAYAATEKMAGHALQQAELPRAGNILVFDAANLLSLSQLIMCELFRQVWLREGWPMGAMGSREWHRLRDIVIGKALRIDLPGSVHVARKKGVVQLQRRQ